MPDPQNPELPTQRTGDALIAAAAADQPLSGLEAIDLLDYFASNKKLPGDPTTDLHLLFGDTTLKITVRRLRWEEYQSSLDWATSKETGRADPFVTASYNVAQATVTPDLKPVLANLIASAKASDDKKIEGPDGDRIDPPKNIAGLLRLWFAGHTGVLLQASGGVLEHSKLSTSNTVYVREIEAGKG